MKLFFGFIFILSAQISFAGSKSIDSTWTTTKSVQEIRTIVTGVEHLCAQGCTYRMPSVTSSSVVSANADRSSIIYWTFVASFVEVRFFSQMTVTRETNGISIISQMLQNPGRNIITSSMDHSPAPMNNNKMEMRIIDNGSSRQINLTLSASGGLVVREARLERELNASINAYKAILN